MQKHKNIWLISQYTGSPHYGMNYRGYYLAKEFVANGDKVTLFSSSYSHLFVNYPKVTGLFTEETIDGINYIWVKGSKYKGSKSIGRVLSMLMFMLKLFLFNIFKRERPDVIIISSLSLFPILNAYIWSKIFKVEFILEIRDIWPLTLMEVGGMSKYHPLVIFMSWFEKLGYRKAKYVVSLLPNAKEHMLKNGMKDDKFRYIPNGVNLQEVENYEEVTQELKNKFPKDKFIVGYLGTIGIANAMEYFLETAKKMKDNSEIHFVLVGNGGEKERLQDYSHKHALENVTFIDAIKKVQVQGILKYFDVCYLGWHNKSIYKYGVSANKIFDYMYSAKPIINSINIDNDIITKAKCGLTVKAEDSGAIKKAILELFLTKTSELEQLGKNGKSYVIKHHDYGKLVKKYRELMD
jgi:glycosyltransferase involved in cell wall biosynthesis